jgi:hypothetical protein
MIELKEHQIKVSGLRKLSAKVLRTIEAEEVLVISTKGEKLAVTVNYNTYLQIHLKKLQNLATRLHDVRMFAVDPGASRSSRPLGRTFDADRHNPED